MSQKEKESCNEQGSCHEISESELASFRWSVRLARVSDESIIRSLVQDGMRDYAARSGLTPALATAKLGALTEADEILRADLRAGCVLACFVDSVLVGTLRLKALPDKLLKEYGANAADSRLLTRFAIHPQYRAMGLGSAVLRAALRWSAEQGISFIYLYTAMDNKNLFAFYQSFGFSLLQLSFDRGYARALLLAKTPSPTEAWMSE